MLQPPQSVKPWQGVLDSTKEANDCVQPSAALGSKCKSEDCLYLNVYTPKVPSALSSSLNLIN
jgi:carboxylesterase type B